MLKVKGYSNLYRDENTGAIINCDSSSYDNYVNYIEKRDKQKKELDDMKKDIDEIKTLLKEFINGSK